MRRLIILLIGVGALATNTLAQLTVQIRLPRPTLLVCESIPVTVNIQNYSGHPIQLADDGDSRWLKFEVTDGSGSAIPVTGTLTASAPVIIEPGKAVTQTIDLLPLFAIRSRGLYKVQASVHSPAGSAVSTVLDFRLMQGREIWTQTVGLPGSRDEYRNYALVTRRDGNVELLFAAVREDAAQATYSLVPFGELLPTDKPQARLDKQGHLHVLFQNGARSFGYVHIDPAAKVQALAAYSNFDTWPELTEKDGVISVVGGEQTYPKSEHIMTADELNPPTPAPVKPKKKTWWPFGRKSS